MDVRLPNGQVISGVPEGTTKEQVMQKAIAAGIAKESDFAQPEPQGFQPEPAQPESDSNGLVDFLIGKEGERSVFNAPELNEFSLRAFKAGLGGIVTGDTDEIKSIIGANYPEAKFGTIDGQQAVRLPSGDYFLQPEGLDAGDVGRFVFDVAAFTPAGRIAGTSAAALGKGALAAGATQAGQEAVEAAVGGEFSPGEVALEAAMGPAGQVAEPLFKAAGSKARDAVGYIADKIRRPELDATGRVGQAIASRQAEKIVPEVMADPSIIEAAEDLGVDLNPAHYSNNEVYKEYELGLKMIPQSKLSANEKQAISTLSQRADEVIAQYGGVTDKSDLSESVKDAMQSTVNAIKDEERVIYQAVEDAVPKSQKVIPKNTMGYLQSRIDEVGGVKYLSPAEKAIMSSISGTGKNRPTFQRLVEARRNVHSPSGMNNPFANTDKRIRDNLYNAIKQDERGVIGFFSDELLQDYDRALEIGAKRFSIQDQMVEAFGKDLSGTLFKGIKTGVKKLSEGDVSTFSQAMERVPEDLRPQVAVTALNDIFTAGARTAKDFSLSGFVSGWEGIRRNSRSMAELKKYIPKDALDTVDKMYRVSKGIMDANKRDLNNPSGTARAFLAAMDAPDGVLSKLYRTGKSAAAAEAVTTPSGLPGVGAVGVIASELSKGKTKATEAADELLSSPAFKKAVQAAIDGAPEKANKIAESIGAAKRWLSQQPPEVKRQVARQGLITYLSSSEQEEQPQ